MRPLRQPASGERRASIIETARATLRLAGSAPPPLPCNDEDTEGPFWIAKAVVTLGALLIAGAAAFLVWRAQLTP